MKIYLHNTILSEDLEQINECCDILIKLNNCQSVSWGKVKKYINFTNNGKKSREGIFGQLIKGHNQNYTFYQFNNNEQVCYVVPINLLPIQYIKEDYNVSK